MGTPFHAPFDADTRIDTFMKADLTWYEIDFAQMFRGLERYFGFTCSDKEWLDFFGFEVAERSVAEWDETTAPNLTFGALARFIANRAPVIASFDPISMIGRDCATAGVFTGIQQLAGRRIAPSVRIFDVIRGRDLDRFWTQLRWMTENVIPPLPFSWRRICWLTGCFCVVAMIAGAIAIWATSVSIWFAPTTMVAAACYVIASAYKRNANPLPPDIVTFRDLSVLIAEKRNNLTTM